MPIAVPIEAFISERAPPAGTASLATAEPARPVSPALVRGAARRPFTPAAWMAPAAGPPVHRLTRTRGPRVPSAADVALLAFRREAAKRVAPAVDAEVYTPRIDIRGLGRA